MIYDIHIVGDGIIAYSIAYELRKRDPSLKIAMTTLYPKRELRSASLAAGAMINVYSELDVNTFESDISIQKLDMAIHSLEMWDEWASDIGVGLHSNYTLVKKLHESDAANFDIIQKEYYRFHHVNNAPSITLLEPWVCPVELYTCLQVNCHNVAKFSETIIESKITIYAAGAYTKSLVPNYIKQRTFFGHGCGIHVTNNNCLNHVIRTPNRTGTCGVNIVPYNDHLYVGATNDVAVLNNDADGKRVASIEFILSQAKKLYPEIEKESFLRLVYGPRPLTEDTFPLIGKVDENVYVCTGTRRDGITMSPLLARDMASRILEGHGVIYDKDVFNPLREPHRNLDLERTKEQTIQGLINDKIIHGTYVTHDETSIRAYVEKRYADTGVDYGIPPELIHVF